MWSFEKMYSWFMKAIRLANVIMACFVLVKFFKGNVFSFQKSPGIFDAAEFGNFKNLGEFHGFYNCSGRIGERQILYHCGHGDNITGISGNASNVISLGNFGNDTGNFGNFTGNFGNVTGFGNFTPFGNNFTDSFGNTIKFIDVHDYWRHVIFRLFDWPNFMDIRMSSFFHQIPDPNYDVTDEALIAAWKLPPKTRLSPDMRRVARCVLAAKNNTDYYIDDCFVVDKTWPIWVVGLLGVFVVYNSIRLIFGPCCKIVGITQKTKYFLNMAIPYWSWCAAYCLITSYCKGYVDMGIWYKPYGEFKPQAYYSLVTEDFKLIANLLFAGACANMFELVEYTIRVSKIAKEEIAAEKKVIGSNKIKPTGNDEKPKKMEV